MIELKHKMIEYNKLLEAREMEKQESFVNEDLNTAFVEGDLNKTVTASNNQSNTWNLLDDPNILDQDEPISNFSNILQKETKSNSNNKNLVFMEESSIRPQKIISNSNNHNRAFEEDEDIKDLFLEMTKGKKNPPNFKK